MSKLDLLLDDLNIATLKELFFSEDDSIRRAVSAIYAVAPPAVTKPTIEPELCQQDWRSMDRSTDWEKFELFLVSVFRKQDYTVEHVSSVSKNKGKRRGDGGCDMEMSKGSLKFVVDATLTDIGVRKTSRINAAKIIRKFDVAILVTTGKVSSEARREASDLGIILITRNEIDALVAGEDLIAQKLQSSQPVVEAFSTATAILTTLAEPAYAA